MFSEGSPAQALFSAALELLSRREHSRRELREKLSGKFPDADFDALFLRLQELNYQSDQRFAELFARSRVQRGQGPLRIRRELQQRGVSADLIERALELLQEDWFQLAAELLQRKFRGPVSEALPREQQLKERARRQRYLAYRGFPSDAIHWALDAAATDLYSQF
ncbi:RecX family transcriptional regulator [Microbulbifer flavimaris]|uniref:Regulatory protein RecX n=1 Tax=Microbulbifer flavimaris TaxID=1781068 RepID=A0ABX4HWV0_9GAMM|nr:MULTISPECIES: regulatory protein RecX [Microbulbifer]KUJ81671.1 RecX family transcriptional regulator [Microbulbifer sp. ZGT114]PCO04587.1 RecX family transcriptional regulator [Microbulbifer flavimaris]